MMLRGMGFGNNTSIYLASGKIYQEDKYLRPLLKMFPKLYTKETLASQDELAPFKVFILLPLVQVRLHNIGFRDIMALQFNHQYAICIIISYHFLLFSYDFNSKHHSSGYTS